MREVNKITGKIFEDELEILAGQDIIGGTEVAEVTISRRCCCRYVLPITFMSGICPTSACTSTCAWKKKA